jgi:hypothetical protein
VFLVRIRLSGRERSIFSKGEETGEEVNFGGAMYHQLLIQRGRSGSELEASNFGRSPGTHTPENP